jgi:SSS family solute:Na+ symporter
MCAVVLAYVLAGGLRGTAWANTFQTLVFMILGGVTFAVITSRLGGLSAALARVAEVDPSLLMRGDRIGRAELWSYTAIPLSVAMFPHIFMHWLTAKSARTFRAPIIGYPLCVMVVWLPSVLLGVIGAAEIAGLEGPAANSVLVRMIALNAPGLLAGLLAAGVFAAVMSSLDSQTLAASSMFTHDIVRHYGLGEHMDDRRQVLAGRLFVVVVLAATFAIALLTDRSIFKMGIWAFSGFSALAPVVVAALYWRRSTAAGAIASVSTATLLWLYFLRRAWNDPGYSPFGWGFQPVVILLAASTVAMVVVSLFSRPPEAARLARFFDA